MASTTRAQPKPKEKRSGCRSERDQNSGGEAVATGLFRKLQERGRHVTGNGRGYAGLFWFRGAWYVCTWSRLWPFLPSSNGCLLLLKTFLGLASASPRFLVRSFVFALALSSSQRYWSFRGWFGFLWRSRQWKVALRLLIVQPLLTALDKRVHASLPRLFPISLAHWQQQDSTWFSGLPGMWASG